MVGPLHISCIYSTLSCSKEHNENIGVFFFFIGAVTVTAALDPRLSHLLIAYVFKEKYAVIFFRR